jgi:hypothetical protein
MTESNLPLGYVVMAECPAIAIPYRGKTLLRFLASILKASVNSFASCPRILFPLSSFAPLGSIRVMYLINHVQVPHDIIVRVLSRSSRSGAGMHSHHLIS